MEESDVVRLVENFTVHSHEVQDHAVELYDYMRKQRVTRSSQHGGFLVFSQYQDVCDIEWQPEQFSSFPVTMPPLGNPVPMIPIEMDPPLHQAFRHLIGARFTPSAVRRLEPEIREFVVDLIEKFRGQRNVDLVDALCKPLTLHVLLSMLLGVPEEDHEMIFSTFVEMMQPDPSIPEDEIEANRMALGLEVQIYIAKLLDARRGDHDANDLISVLARAELDGQTLTDDEILGFCFLLIPAGFDTTKSTLGLILQHLAEHPEMRKALAADETRIPAAIEEFLRYTSVVTGQARTVTSPCEFANTALDTGDRVVVLWASANRDEQVFPRANEVVLDRSPNRHLAFGTGIHNCIGSHLARLQLRLALEEFLRRVPEVRPDPESDAPMHPGETWGLERLPVIIDWAGSYSDSEAV